MSCEIRIQPNNCTMHVAVSSFYTLFGNSVEPDISVHPHDKSVLLMKLYHWIDCKSSLYSVNNP